VGFHNKQNDIVTLFSVLNCILPVIKSCVSPIMDCSIRNMKPFRVKKCFFFTEDLLSGNKMPTRSNRDFYCRSYWLLNMFRAPLCPSSGAQEYHKMVAACGISCCGFQVAGLVWSWGLCVRSTGCCSILQTGHITLASATSCKPDT